MKKFFAVLLVALFMVACDNTGNQSSEQAQDTVSVVVTHEDTSAEVKSVEEAQRDTVHCAAFTKAGTRCKNHVAPGDTLCYVHKRLLK